MANLSATGPRPGSNESPATAAEAARKSMSEASETIAKSAQGLGEKAAATMNKVNEASRDVAAATTETASNVAANIEDFGRKNPFAAMGIAMLIGMVFGLMRRSQNQ